MDGYQPHSLYSIEEEVTPQDHQLLCHGATSSKIERLPSRLQQSKVLPRSMKKQVEDLAYEVSYLKAELSWHSETKGALLQFQEHMYEIFHRVEDALIEVNTRLREAEHRYLRLWGLDACTNEQESMI